MSGKQNKLTRSELQGMIARAGYGEGKVKLNLCGYDLTGVDLSYLDLSGARLLHCILDKVIFYYTDMSEALLEECEIDNIDLDPLINNFNGTRIVYKSIPDDYLGGVDIHPVSSYIKELQGEEETENPLRFFQGATVIYWDWDSGEYITFTIPSELDDNEDGGDDDEGGGDDDIGGDDNGGGDIGGDDDDDDEGGGGSRRRRRPKPGPVGVREPSGEGDEDRDIGGEG